MRYAILGLIVIGVISGVILFELKVVMTYPENHKEIIKIGNKN